VGPATAWAKGLPLAVVFRGVERRLDVDELGSSQLAESSGRCCCRPGATGRQRWPNRLHLEAWRQGSFRRASEQAHHVEGVRSSSLNYWSKRSPECSFQTDPSRSTIHRPGRLLAPSMPREQSGDPRFARRALKSAETLALRHCGRGYGLFCNPKLPIGCPLSACLL
jgi:hypothetical protein